MSVLSCRVLDEGVTALNADHWDALTGSEYPFLTHAFLSALEQAACLGTKTGWIPRPLIFEDESQSLIAAVPAYLKFNSFGEFVFDWSWAEAYDRAGLAYYPKLVVAAPFTPASGPRLLIHPEYRTLELEDQVIRSTVHLAKDLGASSLHWLFSSDSALERSPEFMTRSGCQFHWNNDHYRDFDEFLSRLTSKRRKEIVRERRQVRDAGVELRQVSGEEAAPWMWEAFYELYVSTFERYGNYPALGLEFFQAIAATMGQQIRLVLAFQSGDLVAGAFFLVGHGTLYGRYWGCRKEIPSLHFETCYYQGIEYCIESGLSRFEPGAQGEHKLNRGFVPHQTRSFHWIEEPGFRQPIQNFLDEEGALMDAYIARLVEHSPYR